MQFDSGNGEWSNQGRGNHEELMAQKGWYYETYQAQQLSEEMEESSMKTSEARVMTRLLAYMWRYKWLTALP